MLEKRGLAALILVVLVQAASTLAAKCGVCPLFFIIGIVTDPVTITLAGPAGAIDPKMPLPSTATLAGPPVRCPNKPREIFMMARPAPDT